MAWPLWTGLMLAAVQETWCEKGAANWYRPRMHDIARMPLQVSHCLRGGGVDLGAMPDDSSRAGRGRSAAASAGLQDDAKRSYRKLKATVPPHAGPDDERLEASCDSSRAEASIEDDAGVCAAGPRTAIIVKRRRDFLRARGVDDGRTGSTALRSDGRPSATAEGSAARQRGPSDTGVYGRGMRVEDDVQETISRNSSI